MRLERMEELAVDLSRWRRDLHEASQESLLEARRHVWHDPELQAAAEIARRGDVKALKPGWPQLMNPETCGQAPSNNTFTTLQAIGMTQQPNLQPNTLTGGNDGTQFHIKGFGILGSAAGTATTTFGVDLNGTATAVMISASMTPATATVQTWQFDSMVSVLTAGSGGTLQASGTLTGTTATPANNVLIPATQPAAPTVNTQTANFFNLVASWSVSAAGNLYQVNGFWVLQYN
jgi:hypothetical protein